MQENRAIVLVVEDENEIREMLCEALCEAGLHVLQAGNGVEAQEIILKQRVDAVLSDVNMPKMRGIDLLKWLRENAYYTPFVILTAYDEMQTSVKALQLGAFDFLEKPWEHEHLVSVVLRAAELGLEFRRWGELSEEAQNLEMLKHQNSVKAINKLLGTISTLKNENERLKTQLKAVENQKKKT